MDAYYWDESEGCEDVTGASERTFDLVVHRETHLAPGWVKGAEVLLANGLPGPNLGDFHQIRTGLDRVQGVRLAACGGARELAAAALGGRLSGALELGDLARSEAGQFGRPGKLELKSEQVRSIELSVIPQTLLACQTAPAKTYIVNDAGRPSTCWASFPELRPNNILLDFDALASNAASHPTVWVEGLATVTAVLLECALLYPREFGSTRGLPVRPSAGALLDRLASAGLEPLRTVVRGVASDDHLRFFVDVAMKSREIENEAGPAMPALALAQSITRHSRSPIRGGRVLPCILLPMARQLGSARDVHPAWRRWVEALLKEVETVPDFDAVCDRAQCAAGAASQTLSIRAGAKVEDHLSVLEAIWPRS